MRIILLCLFLFASLCLVSVSFQIKRSPIASKTFLYSAADSPVPESLKSLAVTVVDPMNSTSTLLNLVALGDKFSDKDSMGNYSLLHVSKRWQRVPGCLSEVYVGAETDEDGRVYIEGFADSRIARGLLALVCEVASSNIISLLLRFIVILLRA